MTAVEDSAAATTGSCGVAAARTAVVTVLAVAARVARDRDVVEGEVAIVLNRPAILPRERRVLVPVRARVGCLTAREGEVLEGDVAEISDVEEPKTTSARGARDGRAVALDDEGVVVTVGVVDLPETRVRVDLVAVVVVIPGRLRNVVRAARREVDRDGAAAVAIRGVDSADEPPDLGHVGTRNVVDGGSWRCRDDYQTNGDQRGNHGESGTSDECA